jgi:predicted dienelactone hydrolase
VIAPSAGLRTLRVNDAAQGVAFPVLLLYPATAPAQPLTFGPFTERLAADAPLEGASLPLVILSHGSGSSPRAYLALASELARHGFVVAIPEHPGNSVSDNSLADTVENLANRPRHVRLTLDAVLADPPLAGRLASEQIALIGHSMGGYTALAVAGGTPWSGMGQPISVTPDPRVKALVLLAPATSWFVPDDSLQHVSAPLLLLIGERDRITPRWHAQLLLDQLPASTPVTFRVIANAGHFSFLSPFPAALKAQGFPPAFDPEGFDREAFQSQLAREIREFLSRVLPSSGEPQ